MTAPDVLVFTAPREFIINPSSDDADDGNDGLALDRPWRTMAPANAYPFVAGDQITLIGPQLGGRLDVTAKHGLKIRGEEEATLDGSIDIIVPPAGWGTWSAYDSNIQMIATPAYDAAVYDAPDPRHMSIDGGTTWIGTVAKLSTLAATLAQVTGPGQFYQDSIANILYTWSPGGAPATHYATMQVDAYSCIRTTALTQDLDIADLSGGFGYHFGDFIGWDGGRFARCFGGVTGQHVLMFRDLCHDILVSDGEMSDAGHYPTQGTHGIDVGGECYNIFIRRMVGRRNAEDGFQCQSFAPQPLTFEIEDCTFEDNYENPVDIKAARRGRVLTSLLSSAGVNCTFEPVTLHIYAPVVELIGNSLIGRRGTTGNAACLIVADQARAICQDNTFDADQGSCVSFVTGSHAEVENKNSGDCSFQCDVMLRRANSTQIMIRADRGRHTFDQITASVLGATDNDVTVCRTQNDADCTFRNPVLRTGSDSTSRYLFDRQGSSTITVTNPHLDKSGETTAWANDNGTKKTKAQVTAGLVGALTITSPTVGDPLFVNRDAGDFHLQAGSPAKGGGAVIGVALDHDGAAFGSPPNRGAFGG